MNSGPPGEQWTQCLASHNCIHRYKSALVYLPWHPILLIIDFFHFRFILKRFGYCVVRCPTFTVHAELYPFSLHSPGVILPLSFQAPQQIAKCIVLMISLAQIGSREQPGDTHTTHQPKHPLFIHYIAHHAAFSSSLLRLCHG